MIVAFLRECVQLPDSPGLPKDKGLSQVLSGRVPFFFFLSQKDFFKKIIKKVGEEDYIFGLLMMVFCSVFNGFSIYIFFQQISLLVTIK